MAVLVIGGSGFVGLNIVEQLLREGETVTLFDAEPAPSSALAVMDALAGQLRVVIGDVCEAGAIANAITTDVQTMVYGAAITAGFERDRDNPEATFAVNLHGFMAALRAARDAGVRRVINLSSAGAYGAAAFHGSGPLYEDLPAPDPKSIYSITKFASERISQRMVEVWGLDVISVRLSGVFGRWERKTNARDTPSPQFQILTALCNGTPALLERVDERDWIYATDVARAVQSLLSAQSLAHQLYNISTGHSWSVLSWGRAMSTHFSGGECRLAKPGELANIAFHTLQDRRRLAIDRIEDDLGFQCNFDLNQSVEDYFLWTQNNIIK